MKRNFYFQMIMIAMMCMASVSANAQGRRGGEHHGDRGSFNGSHNREMVMHHDGRMEMHGSARPHDMGRHNDISRPHDMGHHREMAGRGVHRPGRHFYVGGRYFDPRWEGRIRYERGRWGYLRGHDWYWYDRYYEPAFYFGHPVGYFHHCHVSPEAVVAGAVGAVVVGALINALSY